MKATIKFDSKKQRIEFKKMFSCNCDACGILTDYNEKYDAWFCPICNTWAEEKCNDPDCGFCGERPDTPDIGQ